MIKGKTKDFIWITQGILVIIIALLFYTNQSALTAFLTILFLANFMIIGAGSKVDKLFLVYPYGTFLLIFWGGFIGVFYYWKLFYNVMPDTLLFGMHPGTAILWVGFLLLGAFLTTILSYTVFFERNVISQREWEAFITEVEEFNRKQQDLIDERPEEEQLK